MDFSQCHNCKLDAVQVMTHGSFWCVCVFVCTEVTFHMNARISIIESTRVVDLAWLSIYL